MEQHHKILRVWLTNIQPGNNESYRQNMPCALCYAGKTLNEWQHILTAYGLKPQEVYYKSNPTWWDINKVIKDQLIFNSETYLTDVYNNLSNKDYLKAILPAYEQNAINLLFKVWDLKIVCGAVRLQCKIDNCPDYLGDDIDGKNVKLPDETD